MNTGVSLAALIRRPRVGYEDLREFDENRPELPKPVINQVEIRLKYEGYIKRQLKQVEDFARMEDKPLPEDIDYYAVPGLRTEARQKLSDVRRRTSGVQAAFPACRLRTWPRLRCT